MEKMYSEFIGFREEMNKFRQETNSGLDKIEIKLEHDITNNLKSLHEGVESYTAPICGISHILATEK